MFQPSDADIARLQAELEAAIRLHQQGNLDGAEEAYKRILDRAPSQPDALNLLGVVLAEKNRNDVAVDLINRAARLRPKDANIHNNLGRACVRARRFELAVDALEHAIGLSPNLVEAYGNLIQAHRSLGHMQEARHYIRALRNVKGGSITADYEEARLFSDLGQGEEARALLMRITKEQPQFGLAWQSLVKLSKVKPGDPVIDDLVSAIAKTPEPSANLKSMCYAAGKVFDDLGEYDRAWEFFTRAKRQEPSTYDHERTAAHFRNIAATCKPSFFEARRDFGVDSKRPLFIVGMPRSGTTLAEQILASHPDVYGGGELEYVAQLSSHLAEYVPSGKHPEALLHLGPNIVAAFAYRYLRKIGAINADTARFTDKMPHNFLSLGLLRLMFTNLQVVHCVRHPFDTCFSCYTHDFAQTHSYNRSLEGLASYYQLYRELMEHWQTCFGDRIHTLRYEKLLDNQEVQSRALLGFAGLNWTESVLDFSGTERRVSTPSGWQVRQPLFKSSAGRWRHYAKHLEPALSAIPQRLIP
ncbi:MAG: sulfotransferase [Hyphomonadaceae bacterium]|nr:sulfotransferase [Hyphomonadaceae bacterium]